MADLRDLLAALDALKQGGKTGKVYFYFTLDGDHRLQSGAISVDKGETCQVAFQQMPADAALAYIAGLSFSKVTTLPAMSVDTSDPSTVMAMDAVLEFLAQASQAAAPPPVPPPAPVAAPPPAAIEPIVVPAAAASHQHVFYSHVAMQKDAAELLSTLFGGAAQRKVEDIAHATPPLQHPMEFLDKCKQQAAMMVGAKKADDLFKPLYDKLAHR